MLGPELEELIKQLKRLPGFGPRSARRAALYMLKNKTKSLDPLIAILEKVKASIDECNICGNLDSQNPCSICSDPKRKEDLLIVVEDVADLWALERGKILKAQYHILGGHLSPLEGIGPEQLRITALLDRLQMGHFKEVILATNSTIEGQTTAHYLSDKLAAFNLKITKLAHGIPIGGELDYIDDNTIMAALNARISI